MTEWKQIGYLKTSDVGPFEQHTWRYHLELPAAGPGEPPMLGDWDVYDYWEQARTEHMASILRPGDCLYDVGAEFAWLSLVYVQMVGPEHMVLVEPSTVMWPNVRATWLRNAPVPPLAVAHCLVGENGADDLAPAYLATDGEGGWPDAVSGPLAGRTVYTYLHNNPQGVPTVTLDALVRLVGRPPAGITIDVEGAELAVLRGAFDTLREHAPHVWVSIHPDLMARDYGANDTDLHTHMADLGYASDHLGTDHEQHWHFVPAGGAR
jgi:FkbM family methyltransferase